MENAIFQNGASWLRVDFHLHTNADKEFTYTSEDDFYFASYVDSLAKADISVGVIANHNKFDFEEFKALRKTAKKKTIFLLPGVELSVNDGANGVHVLILFSESWTQNDNDRISTFITSMFSGKTVSEYQNENGRSDKNILQTVEELNKTGLDYFLVFAHVEDSKGLWYETGGGKFQDWQEKRYSSVKERTLGFQKVRTRDERKKIQSWLGDWYPAEVEGSDPKKIEDIGKGKACFLKLGAFTFEAVKFALVDHENRLRLENAPNHTNSHIRQISFEGGTLDGHTIRFSPELNTLIGIRGSGKSSVLEALRYGLDIPFGEKAGDTDYKQKLAGFTLGSGGKVIIDAIDRYGQSYQIQRIWKEAANVFIDGQLRPGLTIQETILHKPIYFGQKDLSNTGEGFEKDLVEKLLGSKLDEVRRKIAAQKSKVIEAIGRLLKTSNTEELLEEQTKQKQDAEFRLEFYKKHGLEEKLQKHLAFDADIRKAQKGLGAVNAFAADIRDLLARHEDEMRNFTGYTSKYNADVFKVIDELFAKIIASIEILKTELAKTDSVYSDMTAESEKLAEARRGLADEFAAIERKLAEELKTANGQIISTDDFLALKQKLAKADAELARLSQNKDRKAALQEELCSELQKLNGLWHDEFQIIKGELAQVGANGSALAITVGFKEDKDSFLDYFKSIFKGSGVRETTFKNIVEAYQDFIALYADWESARKSFGNNTDTFGDVFNSNLASLLTFQTPNKFTITYRGKELSQHSLGQRASALILFVLGQRENDVIIIDQPEDDLDNQTIYEDVIKLIRALKPQVQFIFATHNPNIPVLGDAEQIHACSFDGEKITVQSGGLDAPSQQKKIVDIMEGGKEAFERRKEIYRIWKP
jgi:predicted ATPase